MPKIIIDTDPGVDDAMAIFFAGLRPELEITGLTSVFGNVTTPKATRNALRLLEMLNLTAPVAEGALEPLVIAPNGASDYVHGAEGFGDIPAQTPKGDKIDRSAAAFICDMINAHPGEITLCPIGPLTNIAQALALDPGIVDKVAGVVIMGGGIGLGNVTEWAEANIWNDPHAADQVFAADWPVTMIGLDVTTKVTCLPGDFAPMADSAPVLGGFLQQAVGFYMNFYEQHYGLLHCQLHDPTAVIAITHPDLFTIETFALEVILDGDRIGQTVKSDDPKRRAMRVAMGVDADAVKALFVNTLSAAY